MSQNIQAVIINDIQKDSIECLIVENNQSIIIYTQDSNLYFPGDIITVDTNKRVVVDKMENYPFV